MSRGISNILTLISCKIKANEIGVKCTMDMIDEIREEANIRKFAAKQREARGITQE